MVIELGYSDSSFRYVNYSDVIVEGASSHYQFNLLHGMHSGNASKFSDSVDGVKGNNSLIVYCSGDKYLHELTNNGPFCKLVGDCEVLFGYSISWTYVSRYIRLYTPIPSRVRQC